nr:MAG TPA: hypothetical protein [Caudoviricetes sp.]
MMCDSAAQALLHAVTHHTLPKDFSAIRYF